MGDIEIFALRLKELREQMKMTQKDFAAFIEVKQQTLSGYENNKVKPPIDILVNIAKKCNVSIDWLCGLTDKKNYDDTVKTYSDVIRLLLKIEEGINIVEAGYKLYFNQSNILQSWYGQLRLCDIKMTYFFKDWKEISQLHNIGTIDDNLYNLWINQQLENYNIPLLSKEEEREEISKIEE